MLYEQSLGWLVVTFLNTARIFYISHLIAVINRREMIYTNFKWRLNDIVS